ncbi:MAG: hypothetical protein H6741_00095 [Alphaproteobacteria bacterium]|nr:hypothetical protein [Alphaproteobacteria bacterium]MCB9791104.1 hypothetical protein [Alphaproteobacteria bacterium]
MPVSATLVLYDRRALAMLQRSMTLRPLLAATEVQPLTITALALEEVYGEPLELPEADAALLAEAADESVLTWADLQPRMGGGFAWSPRWALLRWMAHVSRQTGGRIEVQVVHERGDMLYEVASWFFGDEHSLEVADYDGRDKPLRRARAARRSTPEAEPPGFQQLALALRDVEIQR